MKANSEKLKGVTKTSIDSIGATTFSLDIFGIFTSSSIFETEWLTKYWYVPDAAKLLKGYQNK